MGNYVLKDVIGEGGMGVVWLAEQTEPLNRSVAIKVAKQQFHSTEGQRRFELERHTLAMLNHPHIATIYESGLSADGVPYFSMEYVDGVPLDRYCDRARLRLRDRLDLFLEVCDAIQFAHNKSVVHRDLKPSNLLVRQIDGQPQVKVIDFGLAKLLSPGDAPVDRDLVSLAGQLIGTVQYMSPEQATLGEMDVDSRTDVYSLGVLLYQLLAGTTPVGEKRRSGESSVPELLTFVRHGEFKLPSQLVSSASSDFFEARSADRKSYLRPLTQDLDWIVLKAMDVDRNLRYQTVQALGDDVRRCLRNEPVEAHSRSRWYHLKKFGRRHQGSLVAAVALIMTLLLGIVGTAIGLKYAKQAEAAAKQSEREAITARKNAERERAAALQSLQEVRQLNQRNTRVLNFVASSFGQVDVDATSGESQWRDSLDRFVRNARTESLEPLERAGVLDAIGRSKMAIGEWQAAGDLFEEAVALYAQTLGEAHDETVRSRIALTTVLLHAGANNDANRQLLQMKLTIKDGRHLDPQLVESVQILGAICLEKNGKLAEAEAAYRQLLPIVSEDRLCEVQLRLAKLLSRQGRIPEEREILETLITNDAMHGEIRSQVCLALASCHFSTGHAELGLSVLRHEIERIESSAGAADVLALQCRQALVEALVKLKRNREAATESLTLFQDTVSSDRLASKFGLEIGYLAASTLLNVGDIQNAIVAFDETSVASRFRLGVTERKTLILELNLANALALSGHVSDAAQRMASLYSKLVTQFGPDDVDTVTCQVNYAMLLHRTGDKRTARSDLADALERIECIAGTHCEQWGRTAAALQCVMLDLGEFEEAETLLRRVVQLPDKQAMPSRYKFLCQLSWAESLVALSRFDEAADVLSNLPDAPLASAIGARKSNLKACCLLHQGKTELGMTMLEDSGKEMQAFADALPANVTWWATRVFQRCERFGGSQNIPEE
ncbi:MAG: protein kinase [Pirellulaceae bacterium]